MIIIKDNYYLYINNLDDINIEKFKRNKKINIIYRSPKKYNIKKVIFFRNKCKINKFKFFIANDENLAKKTKSDGLYISAYNKKKSYNNIKKIGSAHNLKEINEKIFQGCNTIIFSRLFETNYKNKKSYTGTVKFNLFSIILKKKLIPLGGINNKNLLKLNMVSCNGFALMSEIKKKPVISNRLF